MRAHNSENGRPPYDLKALIAVGLDASKAAGASWPTALRAGFATDAALRKTITSSTPATPTLGVASAPSSTGVGASPHLATDRRRDAHGARRLLAHRQANRASSAARCAGTERESGRQVESPFEIDSVRLRSARVEALLAARARARADRHQAQVQGPRWSGLSQEKTIGNS